MKERALIGCISLFLALGITLPVWGQQRNFYQQLNEQIASDYYLVELRGLDTEPIEVTSSQIEPPHLLFEVNLPPRRLKIYQNGERIHSYPVTIGRLRYKTPIGPRKMTKIIWNPWWYPPDSPWAKDEVDTPPGPGNPLGKVKIPLGGAILLHGTSNPRSIGRAASHACMRMHNKDIIEIATWLQHEHSNRPNDPMAERHRKNWLRRSYEVPLHWNFPVDIVYRTVEIEDNEVLFHPDIYRYQHKQDFLYELMIALESIGIAPADVDLTQVPDRLPAKESLRIPIHNMLIDWPRIVAAY